MNSKPEMIASWKWTRIKVPYNVLSKENVYLKSYNPHESYLTPAGHWILYIQQTLPYPLPTLIPPFTCPSM